MPRYIDNGGKYIPGYSMSIETDTASLTNAAYLKKVVDGVITPVLRPSVTTTDEKSLSNVGYVNSVSPVTTPYVAPDLDVIGLTSLVNIGTVNMETESAVIPVTSVSLNKSSTSISVGATETLVATVLPADATNKSVTWGSSSTAAATVSSEGVVTGVAEGASVITVTTVDGGRTATCIVSVTGE